MKEQVNPMLLLPFPVKDNQTPAASMLSAERRRQTKSLVRTVLAILFFAAVALMAPAGLHAQAVSFNYAQTTVPTTGLSFAVGVAVDGAGNVFIADPLNSRVVKVPAIGGAQTTVGTGLNGPEGLAVDGAGNVFIVDNNDSRVIKVPANGGAQTTVGTGLNRPFDVAVDGAGNIFIADTSNNRVVKVPANGSAQTTVGTGLSQPDGVAVDRAGNVFISDADNNRVVEVPANGGAQTTVVTGLNDPYGVAVDGAGNLFIADAGNNRVVEVPANGGAQTTVGTGLSNPVAVAVDGAGNVFIADDSNKRVEEVQRSAVIFGSINVCPAGPASCNKTVTLNYTVNDAATIGPVNVVTLGAPNLDFTLSSTTCTGAQTAGSSCTVKVAFAPTVPGLRTGAVQIVDGSGNVLATTLVYGIGKGPQIAFDSGAPARVLVAGQSTFTGVAVDGAGNAYIVDNGNNQVLKVTPGGTPTPFVTGLALPSSVAVDGAGDVFVTNILSGQITKSTPAGVQTTISLEGVLAPLGIAVDGAGNLFVVSGGNSAVEISASGVQTTIASGLNQPGGIAVDGAGNVFIADTSNNQIVEVPLGKAQTVVPLTGLSVPSDVKVDAAGDLFIADNGNNRLVKWSATGVQTTVPTNGVSSPYSLALDGAGDLFVTDNVANLAAELVLSQPPAFNFAATNVGSTSSDSPQSVTVENIGNGTLSAIAPGLSIGANFAQAQGSGTPADCTASFSLAPGSSCNLSISFTPTVGGAIQSSAILTDNAPNANPATQSIQLTGTGDAVNPTLTLTVPDQTYGVAPFALDAISNSTGAITYVVSGPATLSGSVLTITGTGHVMVQAQQAAAAGYNAATARTSFTVNPATLTVTAVDATRVYGAPNPNFTYTITGYMNGDTSSVVSGTPQVTTMAGTGSAPGTYPINVQKNLNATNYNFTYVSGTLTITQASQTINFAALPNVTYGAASIPLSATASSGRPITYTVTGPAALLSNGSTLNVTGAGTVAVTANQTGDQNYTAATAVTQSFMVSPATLTVTANNVSRAYGAANPNLNYSFSGFVHGDNSTVISGTATVATAATTTSAPGTYPVTFSAEGLTSPNYNFTYVNGTLTVTQASQTISFTALPNVTYGVSPITLAATASSGLAAAYTVTGPATLTGSTLTVTGTGTVAVTANQTGNPNYTAATAVTQSFTVSPATLTVTPNPVTQPYGATNPTLAYTVTGFVKGDTLSLVTGSATVTTTATTTAAPGTYPISFATEGLTAANYNFNYVNGTLTVTQASQTINFAPLSNVTYGTAPITLAATTSSGQAATYTVTGPAALTGSTLTITGTGTVSVTANQTGNPNYTAATAVTQSFTVSPATLTVTPNNATQQYGATNSPFTYTVTGFVNGDPPSLVTGSATPTTTATTTSAPGTYPITFSTTGLTAPNYSFNYLSGTLTITQASQAINFAPLSNVTYGTAPITLAATASSGQAVAYTVTGPATVAGSTLTVTGAGTVAVTANQAGNTDYNAANAVTHSFIVSQAALTITANNVSRAYGAANPAFNYTVTGLVNGDSSTLVHGTAALTTTATATSAPGTYPISFATEGLTATNYSFNYVSGTLTINQTSQTISFAPLSNVTYGAGPITLGATASSGLPVSYTVAGPATVTGSALTITGTGTVTVTASQMGNPSYTAATAVTQSFSVAAATPTLTFSVPSQSSSATPFTVSATSNSSGAITYSVLSGPATISGNRVTLTGTGTVTLLASQAASGNYTAATAQASFSVSAPGAITINGGNSKLNFGVFPFGLTGTNQITFGITINNNSPATTSISAAFVNSPSNYSIVQNGCSSSHSGYSSYCQVTIGFTQPTTLAGLSQTYSGTLVFTSSNPAFGFAGGGTVTVTAGVAKVYTNAPYGTTAANPYNFGSANNGSTGASLSFQIFNPSGWNNSGAPASVSLNNYNNWNFTGGCNGYLGDNGQCASTLQFKGSYPSGQTNNGTLTIGNSSGVQVWNSDGSAVFGKLYLTGNTN